MAKWGEGDPRWIVEERPDGTNVNNWHWTEKNATNWSKDKLTELLMGLVVEDDECICEIKTLSKVDGEASANNRKGKLIFFYEWNITGEWSGILKAADKKHKGKFEIPNLSEENDADEINFEVTIDESNDESCKLKEVMRKKGQDIVREKMAIYMKELKEEYGKGVVLPTKGSCTVATTEKKHSNNILQQEMNKVIINPDKAKPKIGVRIHTNKLEEKEEFKCRAEDLYRALTDKEMVQAFTSGPVSMEVEKGGRFSLLNGNITGEFVELVHPTKIIQKWRVKSWPAEHYSTVTFNFVEKEDCTILNMTQTGVPDSELERTREGWKVNYWNRIKQIFGYGSNIFC